MRDPRRLPRPATVRVSPTSHVTPLAGRTGRVYNRPRQSVLSDRVVVDVVTTPPGAVWPIKMPVPLADLEVLDGDIPGLPGPSRMA